MYEDDEYVAICPACGEPIDYCQGHGGFGDSKEAKIIEACIEGEHSQCHPNSGCRS